MYDNDGASEAMVAADRAPGFLSTYAWASDELGELYGRMLIGNGLSGTRKKQLCDDIVKYRTWPEESSAKPLWRWR